MKKEFLAILLVAILIVTCVSIRSKVADKNQLMTQEKTSKWTSGSDTSSKLFACYGNSEDSNWEYTPNYTTITCSGNEYVGAYGSGGSIQTTYDTSSPHRSIAIGFQFVLIDSWDNETFTVTADGETVFSLTYTYTEAFFNQCGSQWPDKVVDVRFGFNHSASSAVLVFSSNLASNSTVEGWGLCNLEINTLLGYSDEDGNQIGTIKPFIFSCSEPALDTDWTYTPYYQTTNCTGGMYVGGYGYGDMIQSGLYIPHTHFGVIISFRVILFGTWANETFNLIVDETTVYSLAFDSESGDDDDSSLASTTCGSSDTAVYKEVRIGLNHTASAIAFEFSSTLSNESSSDASWGICNLFINPTEREVYSDGFMYGGVYSTMTTISPPVEPVWTYIPMFNKFYCDGFYYIGPYGAGGSISFYLNMNANHSLTMEFTLILLDSWDNETFFITVDGQTVYSYTHSYKEASSNVCGNFWPDEIVRTKIGVNHSLPYTEVVISSNLDSDAEDESWGITGVYLVTTAGPVMSDGSMLNLIKSPVFSCLGPVYDPDWTYSPSFTTTQCSTNTYVGAYSSGGSLNVTYYFLQLHHGIILQLKLALFGEWDNNTFTINADGIDVYSLQYSYNASDSVSCGSSYDDANYIDVKFGFNHSAFTLTLNFTSDIDDDDLAWGICGVDIEPAEGLVYADGNEFNAIKDLTFSCQEPEQDIAWAYAPTYQTVTCTSGYNYVGDFGTSDSVYGKLRVPESHKGIIVSFNLALFDTWDNTTAFYVKADHQIVFAIKPADYYDDSSSLSSCNDAMDYLSLNVTFGFNHSQTFVTFEFTSTLNSDSVDQSWGICDLSILSTYGYVEINGSLIQS